MIKNIAVVALVIGGLATLLLAIAWGGALYWDNPDMTRQRLWLEFWREYLVIWLICTLGLGAVKIGLWIDER